MRSTLKLQSVTHVGSIIETLRSPSFRFIHQLPSLSTGSAIFAKAPNRAVIHPCSDFTPMAENDSSDPTDSIRLNVRYYRVPKRLNS